MSYIMFNEIHSVLVSRIFRVDMTLKEYFGFRLYSDKALEEIFSLCDFHRIEIMINAEHDLQ